MAEKKKKKGAAKDSGGDQSELKREQKLQAILLADSFSKTFRPITWENPKVLLPLVNVPMLEYTIEFLAQNGVEELFVFCVWHADKLQAYINGSKWANNASINVRCIASSACLSAGDALREMDSMGIVRSDPFIMISGDVISNMDLKRAIAFHKEKRRKDSNAVMTVVLKKVDKSSGVKPVLDDLTIAYDRLSMQLLLFEDSYKKASVAIPVQTMADHFGLVLRTDLLDCHVDICSPELMVQFSDNFDYQDIRRDFIQNEVVNWDLGMHIYGYVLRHEYAARVHDPRTYHSICRDIVSRWVYPLVPDAQLLRDSSYVHSKRYTYREQGVRLARSAKIGECVVLGSGAVIEENAVVARSVVGRNCVIKAGAVVEDSHLWEGSVVEERARVRQAIVCNGAVVRTGASVGRGCILSYGVIVDRDVKVPDFTRVSCKERLEDPEDEPQEQRGYDVGIVGGAGVGYVWNSHISGDYEREMEVDDDDDDDSWRVESVDALKAHCIGCSEEEAWKRSLWQGVAEPQGEEDSEGEEDGEEDVEARAAHFVTIVSDICITGHAEGHPPENLLMEIKGFKFAQNRSFGDCVRGVTAAVLTIADAGGAGSSMGVVTKLQAMLGAKGWGYGLLKPLLQDAASEAALVEAVEVYSLLDQRRARFYSIFRLVLQILYDSELLSEDALEQWARARRAEMGSPRAALFLEPQVQAFVSWLEAEDDEEDEEEED